MSESEKERPILEFVLFILLVAALVAGCWIIVREVRKTAEMDTVCALGGYTDRMTAGEVYVCIGVADGEWQIEPLDDVRARMAQKGKVN